MTENAIKGLLFLKEKLYNGIFGDKLGCINEAIQALEEIQQYRAIGTPTQIYEKIGGLDVELGKYRVIGTVEEFKALKEEEECFDRNIKMFNKIGLEIRNKAIDEFTEEAMKQFTDLDLKHGYPTVTDCKVILRDVAERLRGEKYESNEEN